MMIPGGCSRRSQEEGGKGTHKTEDFWDRNGGSVTQVEGFRGMGKPMRHDAGKVRSVVHMQAQSYDGTKGADPAQDRSDGGQGFENHANACVTGGGIGKIRKCLHP